MSRQFTALPTLRRLFVASLAVTCLLLQALVLSHQIAVRHERCAAHGELIHVPLAVEDARSSHLATELSDASHKGTPDHKHHHEHCAAELVVAHSHRASVVPVVSIAVTTVPAPGQGNQPFTMVGSLFRLAPKTSPPTVS